MKRQALYPLRFDPIYQYRLWGGRRLPGMLAEPLPGNGPIGEAWVLSDREDHPSRVADGALQGRTIAQLMGEFSEQLMGGLAGRFRRFPLLLKFLDVHEMLSVQVHPADDRANLLPPGETGKTEGWVVLEAAPASCIYAGLKPGSSPATVRTALSNDTLADHMVRISPKVGDAVFTPAGTVHSLGGDVMVFEIQENSDVTFRLYDWGTSTRRPVSLVHSRSSRQWRRFAIERARRVWLRPSSKRRRQSAASKYLTTSISFYGVCAGNCPFPLELPMRLGYWSVFRAPAISNMMDKLTLSPKGRYGSCQPLSGSALSGQSSPSLCLKFPFRNEVRTQNEEADCVRFGWDTGREQVASRCRDVDSAA